MISPIALEAYLCWLVPLSVPSHGVNQSFTELRLRSWISASRMRVLKLATTKKLRLPLALAGAMCMPCAVAYGQINSASVANDPSRVRGIVDLNASQSGPIHRPGPTGSSPSAKQPRYGGGPITPTPAGDAIPGTQPLANGGQVLARIDGQLVLAADVNWQVHERIRAVEKKNGQRVPPNQLPEIVKELTRQSVLSLVHTKLLYADFRRNIPPENLPAVEQQLVQPFNDERVPQLIKGLGAENKVDLEQRLQRYGSSLKDIQRQFQESVLAGEWMKQRLPKPKPITHEQLLAYYQDNLKSYEYPAQVTYEELMCRFDRMAGDRNATYREICGMGNTVWNKVLANPSMRGPVFADLAKTHPNSHGFTSDKGGLHEDVTIGSLRCEKLNDALASLEVGQLSPAIESESGFHIVRVLRRRSAGRTPFEEAQSQIRETLMRQQLQELQAAELDKLLRNARVWTAFDGNLGGQRLVELMGSNATR